MFLLCYVSQLIWLARDVFLCLKLWTKDFSDSKMVKSFGIKFRSKFDKLMETMKNEICTFFFIDI